MRRMMVASLLCVALSAQTSQPASVPARPGTRLVFRVDLPLALERGHVRRDEAPRDVVREVAAVVRRRLDAGGMKEVQVEQLGLSIVVLLPAMPPEAVDEVVRLVTVPGSVEMRMVADDDYRRGGVSFGMAAERERLTAWLNVSENRDAVLSDPQAIARYNAAAGSEAGPISRHLRWYPEHAVRVPVGAAGPASRPMTWRVVQPVHGAVRITDPGPDHPNLPGFVPLNLHEAGFTNVDLEFGSIDRSARDEPILSIALVAERRTAFADMSARSIGKSLATVCDGMVVFAPVFRSRVAGGRFETMLAGHRTEDSRTLLTALRGGALRAPLELVSRDAAPRR